MDNGTPMTVTQYTTEWRRTSVNLEAAGSYKWMSRQLGQRAHVLEIGCGSGLSTSSIAATGAKVISIEASASAIDAAIKLLRSQNYSAEKFTLGEIDAAFLAGREEDVVFVEGNALHKNISKKLPSNFFDAISCWLIGAAPPHIAQFLNVSMNKLKIEDMARYRETVQKSLLSLGRNILTNNGVVHLVDRVVSVPNVAIEIIANEFSKRVFGLSVKNDYEEGAVVSEALEVSQSLFDGDIQYIREPGFLGGNIVVVSTLLLLSPGGI